MGRKSIILAATELVEAWEAGQPDAEFRAGLITSVHTLTAPRRSLACSVEQGRVHVNGSGNYLLPAVAERVVECLRMGLSHRETAVEAGCGRGTVKRYEQLNGPFVCPCGQPRTHQGWCTERLKRSPLRKAFLASWFARKIEKGTARRASAKRIIIEPSIAKANWPYLKGAPTDGAILIDAVNAIVPRTFPDFQRADICQDLLLAILEGNATVENLKNGSADAIKRYYKLHPGKFGPVSLDAPIPGTEGLTLADTIRSDAPHF